MTLDLDTPWVEKYRPQRFDDIVSQNLAVNNLKKFVESGEIPHFIFTGPAGTGKTSTALIIAQEILKGQNISSHLLELNASDTVRMSYVRDVLKTFVNQDSIIGDNTIKLVLLDEADNIPGQVQQALRRIMEKASTKVKFILMCNYINNIIDPIISRCAVFRFVNLPQDMIVNRLKFIAKHEKLSIPANKAEEFYNTLFFISGGDLRKAINTLQMSVALELIENLEIDDILRVSGFLDRTTLNNFIKSFESRNFEEARSVLNTIESFDSRSVIRQLIGALSKIKDIKPRNLSLLHISIGDIDYRISQGADERIQILALLAEIIKNIKI